MDRNTADPRDRYEKVITQKGTSMAHIQEGGQAEER
jgi:hypothetical protein